VNHAVPRERVAAIDALRGIAAMMVIVCHLPFSGGGEDAFAALLRQQGRLGVNLFLIASGFAIHMRAATDRELGFLAFWKRRLVRLYPPYLLVVALSAAGAIAVGKFGGESLAVDLLLLVFLLQNTTRAAWHIENGPLWTLALEEQLYLLYSPLLALRKRAGWAVAIGVVAGATVAWRLAGETLIPIEWRFHWFLIGPARWLEWALGALAAEAFVGKVKLPSFASSPLAFALFLAAAEAADCTPRDSLVGAAAHVVADPLYGIAFFSLVTRMVARPNDAWSEGGGRKLVAIGLFSYSLYLLHVPVMGLAKIIGFHLHIPTWGVFALRAALPFPIAWGFHRAVERPFMERSRRLPA